MTQSVVLLFHPDPVEVRVLTGMLRTAGYEVHATSLLSDARAILTNLAVDVVVVDGAQGSTPAAQLVVDARKRFPEVPRLLLVESERSELALDALRTGQVHGVIRRPARSVDLITTVSLALADLAALHPMLREAAGVDVALDVEVDIDIDIAPADEALEETRERLPWSDSQTG